MARDRVDHAVLAAGKVGRAHMARRIGAAHPHPLADGERIAHDRPGYPGRPSARQRVSTSASLRPSSSTVTTPFSSRLLVIEAIQR